MTLLVVLGVVVIATIVAAFYLSLKSGRGEEPGPGDAAGDRQARAGSRAGRSLPGRARPMAGLGAGSSGRPGDDDDDYDVPDYVAARRASLGAGGTNRSSLVSASAAPSPAADADHTDPALRAGYGRDGGYDAATYDGYDAAADTRAAADGYGTSAYSTAGLDAGTGPSARYGEGAAYPRQPRAPRPDGYRPADGYSPGRSFAPSGPDPDFPVPDAGTGEDDGAGQGVRRRMPKKQKPRLGRSKQDYDNDPWPSADELDGVSDDQYWSELSSDKPLATTARAASPGDPDQAWAPGAAAGAPDEPGGRGKGGGRGARRGGPDVFSAPVQADAPSRARRPRAMAEDERDTTAPRPLQQPARRHPDLPLGPRGAEEDPLTSESFSRHAREAADSRSYQSARQPPHWPSPGRPDPGTAETRTMRPDPRGYSAPEPARTPEPGPPGPAGGRGSGHRGTQDLPPGGSLPPARSYSGNTGGYEPPARHSRHASPSGAGQPPPAPDGKHRGHAATPGPGRSYRGTSGGSHAAPSGGAAYSQGPPGSGYPASNGTPSNPGSSPYPPGSGTSSYPGGSAYPESPGSRGGSGEYPRGRRSSSSRRPDDPYGDPYRRPDDRRY